MQGVVCKVYFSPTPLAWTKKSTKKSILYNCDLSYLTITHFLIWTPTTSLPIKNKRLVICKNRWHKNKWQSGSLCSPPGSGRRQDCTRGSQSGLGCQTCQWLVGVCWELWRLGKDKGEYGLTPLLIVNSLANSPDQRKSKLAPPTDKTNK